MGLSNVKKKIYKPVLHGVGWPGDVKNNSPKNRQDKKRKVINAKSLDREKQIYMELS